MGLIQRLLNLLSRKFLLSALVAAVPAIPRIMENKWFPYAFFTAAGVTVVYIIADLIQDWHRKC